MYINGVLEDDNIESDAISSAPLIIGKYNTTNSIYFNGSIDEVSFYNKALTQEEVDNIYQHGLKQGNTNITLYTRTGDNVSVNTTDTYLTLYLPLNGNANDYSKYNRDIIFQNQEEDLKVYLHNE